MQRRHKIGIIGVGYVGTACEIGFSALPNADVRVYDKFKDTESLTTVVDSSDILFICLPTPRIEGTGGCDTSIVESVIADIVKLAANCEKTIVIKSTVPPGTTARIAADNPPHTFIFNPEFLTEAKFLEDFITQDRIILGHVTDQCPKLSSLYKDFVDHHKLLPSIIFCSSDVAEMMKYATNCFLATKVTFFNEIKEVCDKLNIDYKTVAMVMKFDKRIGDSHMEVPGPDGQHGFGGSCFVKDLSALIDLANEIGTDPLLLESVAAKNLLIRERYDWEYLAQVTGDYTKQKASKIA